MPNLSLKRVPDHMMGTSLRFSWSCVGVAILLIAGCDKTGYQKIDGEWSFVASRGIGAEPGVHKLGADAKTFEVLDGSKYAKDKKSVFYKANLVKSADATTFQMLEAPFYAKDIAQVYVQGHVVPRADPETFKIIKGPYGRDKSSVYCGNVAMNVHDVDRFEVVSWSGMWGGHFDKKYFVFEYGDSFPGLQISKETPAVYGRAWARDGVAYYCGPARVEGADYASFNVNNNLTKDFQASDKNHKYTGPFPISEWPQRRKDILGLDN